MTPGVPVESAFGNVLTTEATIKDFQANAAVGEYGIYGINGVLIPTGALSSANAKKDMYVAYKSIDGRVYRTSPMVGGAIRAINSPYSPPINQVTTITNAGVGTINVLQQLTLKVIETTPDNANLPSWEYTLPLALGETTTWAAIAAAVNAANEEEFFTAAGAAAGIVLTGTDPNRHFVTAVELVLTQAAPNDTGVSYNSVLTTASFRGTGTLAQVQELYEWDKVYSGGITHLYTTDQSTGVNPDEFGLPPALATIVGSTTKFDMVALQSYRAEHSPTPVDKHYRQSHIFLALATGGMVVTTATDSGTLGLIINGVTYTQVYATSQTATNAAFVAARAAAILAATGAVVTASTNTLLFDQTLTIVDDASGGMTGTVSTAGQSQTIAAMFA